MKSSKKNTLNSIILSIYVLLILFLLAEILLFFTDYDTKLLWNSLYKVDLALDYSQNLEISRSSENSERIYELVPGKTVECVNCTPPYEEHIDLYKYTGEGIVSTNSLGFRDIEREVEKPQGVYRIIIFGGSNTFGLRVSNNDTYPMQLQKMLDKEYPGKFEVWNAGLCGYVMSQKVAHAQEVIEKYNPDLLIFQDFNIGRRAFFYNDTEFTKHFRKNNELYLENIPFLLTKRVNENYDKFNIHYYLVLHSRFYRFVVISLNNIIIDHIIRDCSKPETQLTICFNERLNSNYDPYGTHISYEKTREFLINNQGIELIIFDNLRESYCDEEYYLPYGNYSHVTYFSICDRPDYKDYYDIHPPPYVYTLYAEKLKEQVLKIYNQQKI